MKLIFLMFVFGVEFISIPIKSVEALPEVIHVGKHQSKFVYEHIIQSFLSVFKTVNI
jgi:hypothetical protein